MTEQQISAWLVREGEAFNTEVADRLTSLMGHYQGPDFFHMAIADALTWTGHAVSQPPPPYYRHASAYLAGNDAGLRSAVEFCGCRGAEGLGRALHGWRAISSKVPHDAARTCTSVELVELQTRAFAAADGLSRKGEISGVAAWLFCGPYKVAALCRQELWRDSALDGLLMPAGSEVAKGLRFLQRRHHSLFMSIGDVMKGDKCGLSVGMGTVSALQHACLGVVGEVGGRVLHVNSGIFKLGRDGLGL